MYLYIPAETQFLGNVYQSKNRRNEIDLALRISGIAVGHNSKISLKLRCEERDNNG